MYISKMMPVRSQLDNVRNILFSNKNRTVLIDNVLSKLNGEKISERESVRLNKTLDYYMNEVYKVRGNRIPLSSLNGEIINVCTADFKKFLNQQKVQNEPLFRETGQVYEIMQQGRQQTSQTQSLSFEDSERTSVELYEMAKKSRENEIQLSSQQHDTKLVVPLDRRELYTITNSPSTTSVRQTHTENITQPIKNYQQDLIIRQESIVNYKEVENNLFLYSADRNWLNSKTTSENRYSFSVLFNTANNGQGFAATPVSQERFKNITHIELIKAILPIESLDVLLEKNSDTSGTFVTSYNRNILSYPYVSVNIQELESNNFGTNNTIDKCFGVLQYDGSWFSDRDTTSDFSGTKTQVGRGFTAMIPKFLKCHRVYSPTPLATLQKMSINILRPDGQPLSKIQDTIDIRTIFSGFMFQPTTSLFGNGSNDCPEYFFINTVPFFSRFAVSIGDTINIKGFEYDNTPETNLPGLNDFTNWINRSEGHTVVAIGNDTSGNFACNDPSGYSNTFGTYISEGPNPIGYANYIIIQARYKDPGTGSLDIDSFTFTGGNTITSVLQNPDVINRLKSPRRLINMSRQSQLVFRIITREMDSVSQIRSDNL